MKIWFQIAADTVGTAADAASTNPITRLLVNFHVDTERFVAQVLAILIVFVALWLFASKPILKTMDERRKKISDGLEYAEEMKQKLAEAEKRQAEMLKEAALEAKRISEDAQAKAREMVDRSAAETARRNEEMVARTREALELERKQMVAEVREQVSRLVAITSSKVLQRELSAEEKSRFANASLKEIAQQ